MASKKTSMKEYPINAESGEDHVAAVSKALATYGDHARKAIDQVDELGDAGTADLFTQISRGIDKNLWFVEAHQQADK
jgi:starvation-inducible DNA-binding protein